MALDDFLNDWIDYQRRQTAALEELAILIAKILKKLEEEGP